MIPEYSYITKVRLPVAQAMSDWCAAQGLVKGVDYDWWYNYYMPLQRFAFYKIDKSFQTLFNLCWGEHLHEI